MNENKTLKIVVDAKPWTTTAGNQMVNSANDSNKDNNNEFGTGW